MVVVDNLVLSLNLVGKLSILLLSMMFSVDLSYMALTMLKYIPSMSIVESFLSYKDLEFCQMMLKLSIYFFSSIILHSTILQLWNFCNLMGSFSLLNVYVHTLFLIS